MNTLTRPLPDMISELPSSAQHLVRDFVAGLLVKQTIKPSTETTNQIPPNIGQEQAAYKQMHAKLLKNYSGEYVAIYEQELIDHDTDRVALYERIDEKYPDEFVLIRPVEQNLEREFYFRSTRFLERI